jgi:anti-sigma regulatory factor (Ser/Thr protein kinase)
VLKADGPCGTIKAILYEAEFYLNGNLGELERLTGEVARFCRENALDEDAEFQLNLALEELFVNAVQHGGCAGMEASTRIHLSAADDGVEVEFADRGRPFDPTTVPAVSIEGPLEVRLNGGLGIHLVRGFMRDLQYRRKGDWNETRMKRPAAQTVPGELP